MRALAPLLLLAACRAPSPHAAEPRVPPTAVPSTAATDSAPARVVGVTPATLAPLRPVFGETMGCLMRRAPTPTYPLFLFGELESAWVPASAARQAVHAAIDVAALDGPSPRLQMARAGVELLSAIDDRPGLAALILAENVGSGVDRAQAGMPIDELSSEAYDLAGVARERALNGDPKEGLRLYRQLALYNTRSADRVGAAAVLGLSDEVQREMLGADQELAEAWLDAVIRSGAPVEQPAAALLDMMKASGSGYVAPRLITRATRLGRALEIEDLINRVRETVVANLPANQTDEASYPYIWALGDHEAMESLAARNKEVKASYVARTVPLDVLLARLDYGHARFQQVVWVWARATDASLTAPQEEQLRRLACGDPIEREPATPPQPKTTITTGIAADAACVPATTVVRLRNARGKLVGNATSEDSCLARIDHVGERDVGVLAHHLIGANGTRIVNYQLALEVCGRPYVTPSFATEIEKTHDVSEVVLRMFDDDLIAELRGQTWNGVVMRVHLPRCPDAPRVDVIEMR